MTLSWFYHLLGFYTVAVSDDLEAGTVKTLDADNSG